MAIVNVLARLLRLAQRFDVRAVKRVTRETKVSNGDDAALGPVQEDEVHRASGLVLGIDHEDCGRRTPQGSLLGPYSTGNLAFLTLPKATSMSSTSIERSGTGVSEPPWVAKLTG